MMANRRTEALAAILSSAIANLKDQKIQFCVLRNYEELPDYTSHDVDILVDQADFGQAVRAITEASQTSGWIIFAQIEQFKGLSLYLFYDKTQTPQFLSFDLVADIRWGWMRTVNTQAVLNNRIQYRDMPVASPGSDAAVRLVKDLLRGTQIRDNARSIIVKGASADHHGFRSTFEGIFNPALTEKLLRLAQEGRFDELSLLRGRARCSVLRHAHTKAPLKSMVDLFLYLRTRRRRARRGSLSVFAALIGPDGAGKTTLARRLSDSLADAPFRRTVIYHSGFNILPRLRTVFQKLTRTRLINSASDQEGPDKCTQPLSVARTMFYLLYYSVDYLLGRVLLRRARFNSHLILFDRYFYNYYYQQGYSAMPWLILDLFRAIAPRPDIILSLRADPRVIHARKDDLDQAEIERQLSAIERLSSKLSNIPVVTLRTDQPEEVTQAQALRAIMNVIADRTAITQNSRRRSIALATERRTCLTQQLARSDQARSVGCKPTLAPGS